VIEVTKTETIILNSGQCRFNSCYACGWGQKKYPVDTEKLKNQVKQLNLEEIDKLKIYESGSFLDNKQFPKKFREWLTRYLEEKEVKEVSFESTANFITEENLKTFKESDLDFTVAMGLEAADNEVLEKYGKPFKIEDYDRAVKKIHESNGKIKTYIMVNIPFSKPNTLEKSVEHVLEKTNKEDKIVLINTYPHNQSKLFKDWVKGKWKPLNKEQFLEKIEKWKDHPQVSVEYENMYFIPKFPKKEKKQKELKGCSEDLITHPHYQVWQDYFQRLYQKPREKEILLFLPCSYKKPYPKSKTHKAIQKAIKQTEEQEKIHRVVLSSPGVIPIDKCDNYPFTAYDWPEWEETPEIKQRYIQVNKDRVKKYIENHDYEKILAYFKPDSESWKAVKKAGEELDIEIKNLFKEESYQEVKEQRNPVTKEPALKSLKQELQKEL